MVVLVVVVIAVVLLIVVVVVVKVIVVDLKNENIVFVSSKVDTVFAVSGQS